MAKDVAVYRSRPFAFVLVKPAVVSILLWIVALVLINFLPSNYPLYALGLIAIAPLIAVIWLMVRWLKWAACEIVILPDCLIEKQGIVRRFEKQIPLDKIQSVTIEQSLVQRVLKCGDLRIVAAGTNDEELIHSIPGVRQFVDLLNHEMGKRN